ncbi:serine/threonine-protein kinase [Polyangium jinanense]|uniref:Protein kinase n=1 Tax=Polyangium jinanense TaxID=2829994 RepID=A0A9X4AW48_9BACT|nr:serine/threonine-protein kinase [Polyangium jinanense]MDC3957560.1 protein kinase [Polyangium jinanense]MDC3984950.1 protein kinase [Polyangium jinanense]
MRICPACSREYPDARSHCQDDGIKLVILDKTAAIRAGELVGQLVDGRYRIERVLGHGGMGTIYACRHVVVGKAFAMKVLRPPRSGHNEGVLARFIREAQTANALKSRHIIETTDFGQLADGPFYVVMELLEGLDLARAMRESRLGPAQLLHVFIQIADTLELVHAHGIVHRDLKPDNVFLVQENGDPLFVKLLDFGIAKVLHSGSSELTEEGMILGTPHYMAPEQARSEGVDHRADVYSLGVMMYRAFTGRLPFTAESTIGVITRHAMEAPEPPSRFCAMDGLLEAMILRCMAKRPEERPQRMAEVSRDLRALAMKSSGQGWPVPSPTSPPGHAPGPYATGNFARIPTGNAPVPMPAATPSQAPPPMVESGATQRGFVTSATGAHKAPPKRSAAVLVSLVVAALAMGGIGAVLAFAVMRGGQSSQENASASSAQAPAPSASPTSPPQALAATAPSEPTTPPPATSAASSPTSSPTTTPAATQTQARTSPGPVRTAAPPPTTTSKTGRRSEIRSPFE